MCVLTRDEHIKLINEKFFHRLTLARSSSSTQIPGTILDDNYTISSRTISILKIRAEELLFL